MKTNIITDYYYHLANNMANSIDSLLLGELVGHKKRIVTKYLKIPVLIIEKHYDTDSEYGTGELEGLLISIKWIETKIPIGKKTIEIPVYSKHKGRVVKWSRYSKLDEK